MDNAEFLNEINNSRSIINRMAELLRNKSAIYEEAGLAKIADIVGSVAHEISRAMRMLDKAEGQWVADSVSRSWVSQDKGLMAALSAVQPGGELKMIQDELEAGRSARAWMLSQAQSIDRNLSDDASTSDCARVISNALRIEEKTHE